jgi:hypothetical protein
MFAMSKSSKFNDNCSPADWLKGATRDVAHFLHPALPELYNSVFHWNTLALPDKK